LQNAAKFIELTIKAVVVQRARQVKRFMFSDAPTAGTDLRRGPVDRFSLQLNAA
jgi:hypothetical protein